MAEQDKILKTVKDHRESFPVSCLAESYGRQLYGGGSRDNRGTDGLHGHGPVRAHVAASRCEGVGSMRHLGLKVAS